jgi:uncharacterized protein
MGIPAFAPRFDTDLLKPFYAGLARGELLLSACSQCGQIHWYPPEVMPCHPDAELTWKTVSPHGVIYTFTTVERSLLPGDHRAEVPFTIVLVAADDAPNARVPGLFIADAGQSAECGMRVRLRPVTVGAYTLPAFAPIE